MKLSVRSFSEEYREGENLILRYEGACVETCDGKQAFRFYQSAEEITKSVVERLAKTEKAYYLSLSAPKEKFAYRPLLFRFSYQLTEKDGKLTVIRKTEWGKRGKILASFTATDTWLPNGFLEK